MVGITGHTKNNLKDNIIKMSEKMKYTHKEVEELWKDKFLSLSSVKHKQIWEDSSPAFTEDRKYCIILDGEIFDFEKDRERLIKEGCKFITNNPAEYILQLFLKDGVNGLKNLNGSYAVAIYDIKKQEVYLFNDMIGTRPIFYHITPKKDLVFGTQMSSILQIKNLNLTLNKDAIFDFFSFEKMIGPRTYYKEIEALPPAGVLHFKKGKIKINKFWEIKYNEKKGSENYYSTQLANLIKQSVERRTRDGLKYGLMLSGGLDSRTILAASKKQIKGFTFADSFNNEARLARRIARLCNAPWYLLKRKKNHYADMVDIAVEIADGRYCFYQAQGVGFFNKINQESQVLFQGFLFDTLFKGCWDRPTTETKINYRNLILDASLYSRKIVKIFKDKKSFEESVKNSINKVLEKCDKNNAIKYNRVFNYFIFPSAYEEIDYLHAAHVNAFTVERQISFDKDLLNLSFNMPLKFRQGPALFKKAMAKINPQVAKIPDANYSIYEKIPFPIKKLIRKTQRLLRKIKPLSKLTITDPSATQISWSNFNQLIINNKKLKNRIIETMNDPNAICPEIFDVSEIKRRFDAHINEKEEYSRFLFQILTFGVWYKKYGPKTRKIKR